MTNYYYISAAAFYYIAYRKGWTVTTASQSQLYKFNKEQDHILYNNKIDIVNFLENNFPTELYRLSFLDFKKFIKLKKEFTNKELRKLLPKRYHNFINIYSQKGADILPLY